jgi:hypothetical protein
MFKVWQNLKALKGPLKQLHSIYYGDITERVEKARADLVAVQPALLSNPSDHFTNELPRRIS